MYSRIRFCPQECTVLQTVARTALAHADGIHAGGQPSNKLENRAGHKCNQHGAESRLDHSLGLTSAACFHAAARGCSAAEPSEGLGPSAAAAGETAVVDVL